MRKGGNRRIRKAKIILLISCLVLAAVLAAGMAMNAGYTDRGAGRTGEHGQSYQRLAEQTGERLNGAVNTAKDKIDKADEAAAKARKKREQQKAALKAQARGGAVSWNRVFQDPQRTSGPLQVIFRRAQGYRGRCQRRTRHSGRRVCQDTVSPGWVSQGRDRQYAGWGDHIHGRLLRNDTG